MRNNKFYLFYIICLSCSLSVGGAFSNEQEPNKKNMDVMLQKGVVAYHNGERKNAAECFIACSKMEPRNYLPYLWLSMLVSHDYERTIKPLEQAIRVASPFEPDPIAFRGGFKCRFADTPYNDMYTEGVRDLLTALGRDPDNVPACFFMGVATMRIGNFDDAISYYNRVLKNTSDDDQSWANKYPQNFRLLTYHYMATMYIHMQAYDEALKSINLCIEKSIKAEERPENMVSCYRTRLKITTIVNSTKALEDIEQILKYDPASLKDIAYQKIQLLLRKGLLEEAAETCRMVLKSLSPQDNAQLVYISCLGLNCRQTQEAAELLEAFDEQEFMDDFKQGLVQTDFVEFFYRTRCVLNVSRLRYEDALKDISSVIDWKSSISNRLMRAKLLMMMGKEEEARNEVDACLPLLRSDGMSEVFSLEKLFSTGLRGQVLGFPEKFLRHPHSTASAVPVPLMSASLKTQGETPKPESEE